MNENIVLGGKVITNEFTAQVFSSDQVKHDIMTLDLTISSPANWNRFKDTNKHFLFQIQNKGKSTEKLDKLKRFQ